MADVFISYHVGSAADVAGKICKRLDRRGVTYWHSETGVAGGEDFARTVPPQIDACKIFLLIVDEGATHSFHVENELGLAFKRKREITILPFRVEKCDLSDWMRYYLTHIQIMNNKLVPPLDERIGELADRIEKILGERKVQEEAQCKAQEETKNRLETERKIRKASEHLGKTKKATGITARSRKYVIFLSVLFLLSMPFIFRAWQMRQAVSTPQSQETLSEDTGIPIIMPSENSADEQANTEQDEKLSGVMPFEDVSPISFCYDSVLWAVSEGIAAGTSPTTFSPNKSCTRKEALCYIWRAMGAEETESEELLDTDMNLQGDLKKAALWAYSRGLETNDSNWDAPCTRIDVTIYLWRLTGSPKDTLFTDIPSHKTDEEWASEWAVKNGITLGIAEDTFGSSHIITRAHMIVFLYRYCHAYPQ